jgi:hypothetical protein
MSLDDLRFIREKLRLPSKEFAAVFGVAVSTLYRWETATDPADLSMDPFRRQIFSALRARMIVSSFQELHELAEETNKAYVKAGSLCALAQVLNFVYQDKQ